MTTAKQQSEMFSNTAEDWCVGPDELANLFDCSLSMIHKYVKNYGMPKEDRGSFNVRKCLKWFIKHLQLTTDDQKGGNEDRSNARKDYIDAQTERTRLEIDQRKGLLIPSNQVADVINRLAAIFSTQMDGLGPRVSPIVATMDDPAKIQEVIFNECRSIRSSVANEIREFSSEVANPVIDSSEDNQPATEAEPGAMG